jgi:hypothetical protein
LRDGAFGPDQALRLAGHLDVVRVGEAVGDQGGLERHDRPTGFDGLPYVVPDG